MNREKFRKYIRIATAIISTLAFILIILEQTNFFYNFFLHLNLLENSAQQLSTSYEPAQRIFKSSDKQWKPLINLIYMYTPVSMPKNRQPLVIARDVAILSAEQNLGNGQIVEWTAPTTPVFVLYKDWPGHGDISPDDYRIVGSIADLQDWVQKDKDSFTLAVNQWILGFLSVVVTILAIV